MTNIVAVDIGGTFIDFKEPGTSSVNNRIRIRWSAGILYCDYYDTNDGDATATISDQKNNTWLHICVTIGSSELKMYQNGSLKDTESIGALLPKDRIHYVGRQEVGDYLKGKMHQAGCENVFFRACGG